MVFPRLVRSATMGIPVAVDTVEASDPVLIIQLGPQSGNTEIAFFDGSGKQVETEELGKPVRSRSALRQLQDYGGRV